MKLLLIDDDEVDRKMVVRLLRGTTPQFTVMQAATAQEGLRIFETGQFAAILLDYLLPDMSGLDVIPILMRQSRMGVAVIILTGASDEALALRCLEAGAQDFLLKNEVSTRHLQRALVLARGRHALEKKLHESHEKYRLLAQTDQLTGLPNRHAFEERLHAEIARPASEIFALLLIDLDHFKRVNDTFGHDIGDLLLRDVAARLCSTAGGNQILCRIAGDEFAVIAPAMADETAVVLLIERIQAALAEPFRVHDADLVITSSIGIAIATGGTITAAQLLKNADLAIHRAKRDGRDRAHFFTPALQIEVIHKTSTERDLRSGALFSQLRLFYQPLVDATSLQVCGAEALIRWQHPVRGLLPPGEFIEIAEEFGLLGKIDAWSRRAACQQMSLWFARKLAMDGFHMSFNASGSTLKREDIDLAIRADCEAPGLPRGSMELEITESVLVANFEKTLVPLERLREAGIGVAIDDFGTGYSSMAYLKRLPASTLKIDRSFLFGVPESEADCRVLKAMIIMAKSLELRVVIEGVETQEQAQFCRECGADVLQGYFFSRPVPAEEFETRFLTAGTSTALT